MDYFWTPPNRLDAILYGHDQYTTRAHPSIRKEMARYIATILVAVISPALPSAGQIFVSTGVGIPMGPENVTEFYNPGFGAGAGVVLEYKSIPFARIRPQGVYQQFRIEDDFLKEIEDEIEDSLNVDVSVSGAQRGIIFAGADVQLRIPYARFSPYVAPAFGLAFIATDAIEVESERGSISYDIRDDDTSIAIGLGVGFYAEVSRQLELFGEAHYMLAFRESNETWIPVRFGVSILLGD